MWLRVMFLVCCVCCNSEVPVCALSASLCSSAIANLLPVHCQLLFLAFVV